MGGRSGPGKSKLFLRCCGMDNSNVYVVPHLCHLLDNFLSAEHRFEKKVP